MNRRKRTLLIFGLALLFLAAVTLSGMLCHDVARKTDFSVKNLRPCGLYLFGTDWLGRDMLARTLTGLSMSIRIGLCTAGISAWHRPGAGYHVCRAGEPGGRCDFLPD